jgi:hypothetical protein
VADNRLSMCKLPLETYMSKLCVYFLTAPSAPRAHVEPIRFPPACLTYARRRRRSCEWIGARARREPGWMIGYAPLPFFAENLLIFAFVGSRTRGWLSLYKPRTKRRLRNH